MNVDDPRPEVGDTIECVECHHKMYAYKVYVSKNREIGEIRIADFGCPTCGRAGIVKCIDGTRDGTYFVRGPGGVDEVRAALDDAGIEYGISDRGNA